MTSLLNDAEIHAQLADLDRWTHADQSITTVRTFPGFPEAIAFVNQLIAPAESAGHHPNIEISYNKVTLTLTTHDAGGLTQKDFHLAQAIDRLS